MPPTYRVAACLSLVRCSRWLSADATSEARDSSSPATERNNVQRPISCLQLIVGRVVNDSCDPSPCMIGIATSRQSATAPSPSLLAVSCQQQAVNDNNSDDN